MKRAGWLGLLALGMLLALPAAAQQTTVTGTIKDLSGAVVTAGQVTFDLEPAVDTTISGNARFVPTEIACLINGSGQLTNATGGACTVEENTAITPSGTYYLVTIEPYGAPSSRFNWYATSASQDITTVVPTPATSPAYSFVDTLSNQTIGGNKTFSGKILAQSLAGIPFADQFSGGTAAQQLTSAESSLVGNGLVVLPSSMQSGNCGYTSQPPSDMLDLRGGGATETANLSFYCNPFDVFVNDDSPRTVNSNAQADGAIMPLLHLEGVEHGAGTLGALYWFTRSGEGATGSLYGLIGSVDAQPGSLVGGVANDMVAGVDQEFAISSISRASNVVTATLTLPVGVTLPYAVGTCVLVNSVTDASFDSGSLCMTLTAVGTTTVSWAQTGSNATSSGGVLAAAAQFFGLELDNFIDAWDPQPLTPTITENVTPAWGFTSTSNGTYPGTAAFFSDGPWYNGYLCGDAKQACFVAGYPKAGGPIQAGTVGFLARPRAVATSGSNYSSVTSEWDDSVWGGSTYVEHNFTASMVAASGASPAETFELCYQTNSVCGLNVSSTGTIFGPNGGPNTPTFAFAGDTTSGFYRDGGGGIDLAISGTERLGFGPGTGGIAILQPGSANATLTFPSISGTLSLTSQLPLGATTASIGGAALAAGACTTGTVAVANATTAMVASTSPAADPGAGFSWQAWVSAAGTVTVRVCNRTAGSLTPTAEAYNVRVIQ